MSDNLRQPTLFGPLFAELQLVCLFVLPNLHGMAHQDLARMGLRSNTSEMSGWLCGFAGWVDNLRQGFPDPRRGRVWCLDWRWTVRRVLAVRRLRTIRVLSAPLGTSEGALCAYWPVVVPCNIVSLHLCWSSRNFLARDLCGSSSGTTVSIHIQTRSHQVRYVCLCLCLCMYDVRSRAMLVCHNALGNIWWRTVCTR